MCTPSHTIHFTLSLPPLIHLSSFPSSPHTPLLFPFLPSYTSPLSLYSDTHFPTHFSPCHQLFTLHSLPSSITLPLPLPPPPLIIPHTHTHTHTLQRLEDEGNTNQKLLSERANAENKIKTLEEQMTLSEDNIAKV